MLCVLGSWVVGWVKAERRDRREHATRLMIVASEGVSSFKTCSGLRLSTTIQVPEEGFQYVDCVNELIERVISIR